MITLHHVATRDTLIFLPRAPLQILNVVTLDARRITYDRVKRYPYGNWRTKDGRTVIFDRTYTPILQIMPDGVVEWAETTEWVDFDKETGEAWAYDSECLWKDRPRVIRKWLTDLGVPTEMIEAAIDGYRKEGLVESPYTRWARAHNNNVV